MPVVTILPGDIEIEVASGETLAQAAWRQDYQWPTTCWGEMACMVCACVVRDGEAAAEPASALEEGCIAERMPRFRQLPGTRLACQLRVIGDGLVVEKEGVRPPVCSA